MRYTICIECTAVSFLGFPGIPLQNTNCISSKIQALLGDLPVLVYSDPPTGTALGAGNIGIADTPGVAEVQKVVISSDAAFVWEVQSLTSSGATGGTFDVTLSGADNSVAIAYDATATELKVRFLSSWNHSQEKRKDVALFRSIFSTRLI